MKFFDTGQHAMGFIAIGQEATGVIAIGQVAVGVIAIGQMARGVFTIGQLAYGFIGWGQLGVGLLHAAGMVGAGGRRGIGGIVPLVPSLGKPRMPPQTTTLQAVHQGAPGWLALDLARDQLGLGLYENGYRLPIKLDRRLQSKAFEISAAGPRRVWASTSRVGPLLVCDRLVYEPPRPYQQSSWFALGGLQLAGLLAVAIGWWLVAGNELVNVLGKLMDDEDARPAVTAPAPGPARTTPAGRRAR
jgi:hypothetical protein